MANLVDSAAKEAGANWSELAEWPEFRDGFMAHAPVDTLRANAFGLCDLHGNVGEWCVDQFPPYTVAARAGDGLRPMPLEAGEAHVVRGGSFVRPASSAGAARRDGNLADAMSMWVGVRLARRLDG